MYTLFFIIVYAILPTKNIIILLLYFHIDMQNEFKNWIDKDNLINTYFESQNFKMTKTKCNLSFIHVRLHKWQESGQFSCINLFCSAHIFEFARIQNKHDAFKSMHFESLIWWWLDVSYLTMAFTLFTYICSNKLKGKSKF